ncbi:hypothetical protein [Cupriavidus basilensis]|uniref:hypothetical protein n=1 Tax=Cupriavidus basilensis TaxID=68895 RepID=UPI0020A6C1C9|nr:hypothetical protein [Cupriavidus basilensis]MCP3018260.1 hypothetical protein [Cupriavidus basilensis]
MENRKLLAFIAPTVAILISGCQDLNSGLASVNQALGTVNTTLGSRTNGTYGNSSAGTIVYVPHEIKQRTANAITAGQAQEINRMIADARPAIENMVALSACGASNSRMTQFTDPNSGTWAFHSPLSGMQYHKSGCLNPVRIAGWQRRTANAISFAADYVSPQSEESTRRTYTAIKQPNGEWLFQWY